MKIYDISRNLEATLPVWPGSIAFERTILHDFAQNHHFRESEIKLNIHTGTHVDAPSHFIPEGGTLKDVDLNKFVGTFEVIDCLDEKTITLTFLKQLKFKSTKLLFKTFNSYYESKIFNPFFCAFTSEAAQYLVEQNIETVGVDGNSVQLFHDKSPLTHQYLLGANIAVIEGLNLKDIKAGLYFGVVLPLKIPDAEGAPARAILIDQF